MDDGGGKRGNKNQQAEFSIFGFYRRTGSRLIWTGISDRQEELLLLFSFRPALISCHRDGKLAALGLMAGSTFNGRKLMGESGRL